MMNAMTHPSIARYLASYQKLYQRVPRELRQISDGWVLVNGMQIRTSELDLLSAQLELEYQQSVAQKRNLIGRLLKWFKTN
jgi:hypothetical protein